MVTVACFLLLLAGCSAGRTLPEKLQTVTCKALFYISGHEVTPLESNRGNKRQRCYKVKAFNRVIVQETYVEGGECPPDPVTCDLGTSTYRKFEVSNKHLHLSTINAKDGKVSEIVLDKKIQWDVPLPGKVTGPYNGEFELEYCEELNRGARKRHLPGPDVAYAVSGFAQCSGL